LTKEAASWVYVSMFPGCDIRRSPDGAEFERTSACELTSARIADLAGALVSTYLMCLLRQILLCLQRCSYCQIHQLRLHRSLQSCSLLPCRRTYRRRLLELASRNLRACFGTDRTDCLCYRRRIHLLLRLRCRIRLQSRCCRRRGSCLRPKCLWCCCYLCCRIRRRLSRCCHCQTRKTCSRLKVRWNAGSSMRGPLAMQDGESRQSEVGDARGR
jgi:hypothetical protein